MTKASGETLVYTGGAVKALGDGRVGGYLVRFSGPKDPDLYGDFFTGESDLDIEDGDVRSVYYQHGYDSALKKRKIGKASLKFDDFGLWAEAQLEMRDDYERFLYDMAEQGKMGWSSGAVAHLVEFEQVGKSQWIKTWPVGEASLTPNPAEPRNTAEPLKAWLKQFEDTADADEGEPQLASDKTKPEPSKTRQLDDKDTDARADKARAEVQYRSRLNLAMAKAKSILSVTKKR